MNPAEYLELMNMESNSAGLHGMNGVSILFAYVVAAYFVGIKLSKRQLVAVNFVYSFFLTIPVLACLGSVRTGAIHTSRFITEHPEIAAEYGFTGGGTPLAYFFYANLILWVFAWVFSLMFMHSSRKNGKHVPIVT